MKDLCRQRIQQVVARTLAPSATRGHRATLPQPLTRAVSSPSERRRDVVRFSNSWDAFLLTVRRRGWRSHDPVIDLLLERNQKALQAQRS